MDFDRVENWGPVIQRDLADLVSQEIITQLATANHQYINESRKLLVDLVGRRELEVHLSNWISCRGVLGYHGTRLLDEERDNILSYGLMPLVATDRAKRIRRALSRHPNWSQVELLLEQTLTKFGQEERRGKREGQVHLTLSRSGLLNAFNHYLSEGSEFDSHVAGDLLGYEGVKLLSADGVPSVVKVLVPGDKALSACNPYGHFGSDLPNLIKEVVEAWSYWLGHPDFKSDSLEVDCGMIFESSVPSSWIIDCTEAKVSS